MKKTLLKLSSLIATSLMLASCATIEYFPKTLDEKAKGIATVKTTPYGCKVLGEIEGKDESPIQPAMTMIVGNSLSALREGAMNDLRNNAVDVIGNSSKRSVLKIVSETAYCQAGVDCPNQTMESQSIHSYLVKAEIFECGDK